MPQSSGNHVVQRFNRTRCLRRLFVFVSIPVLVCFSSVCTAGDVALLRNTQVDAKALNFAKGAKTRFGTNVNGRTYQQQPLATVKGWQYVIYYNAKRHVCLGRRKLPTGAWEIIEFLDYTIRCHDSHNIASLGICTADGTIHLAFDHHAGNLHYRASKQGVASNPQSVKWNAALFGPIKDRLGPGGVRKRVTYPRFFHAPNGNLMLYYRFGGSGNGAGFLEEYDGTKHAWSKGMGRFIAPTGIYNGAASKNSKTRNPYINGIGYAGKRLHVSWGWRENSGGSRYNHDLCYAYSDDHGRTWCNSAGKRIGVTGAKLITVSSPGLIVVPIPQDEGLSNQYTGYGYADGSYHVMVQHKRKYLHCWRDTSGAWNKASLPFAGSRPTIVGDRKKNLFLIYSRGGKLNIAKGVPNAGKTAWTWSVVYTETAVSEGGDGLVDITRWESDGVLSVYGQERSARVLDYGKGKPVDGTPSSLHVLDYRVSP